MKKTEAGQHGKELARLDAEQLGHVRGGGDRDPPRDIIYDPGDDDFDPPTRPTGG
jgi:hypothetical protein